MSSPEYGRFFLPGPTEVHPDVLQSMLKPMIPHRGSGMVDLLNGIEPGLKRLFCTDRPVMIGACAATGFMEMAVRSGVRHRALSLVGGAFGERFAGIVAACGRDVVRVDVQLGKTVEPNVLRDALKSTQVDAVTIVHSETATGALAPLEELAAVVHEFDDVLLLVDTVTSLAGSPVRTDDWKLDFTFTGAQKALALPPGLAFAVASEQMLERAKTVPERGSYFDVVAYHKAAESYQPTNTPAISLLYALDTQLDRIEAAGGPDARWKRHDGMRECVEAWIDGPGGTLGYSYLPDEGRRSWTVSCLNVPEGANGRTITRDMRDAGWIIGSGYGKLKTETVRIGHMGDHSIDRLQELLQTLETVTA